MSEVKCPMNYPNPDCDNCEGQFGKEGLCDHPYKKGMPPELWTQIARILADNEVQYGF